jgi:hypothetical protein
LWLALVGRGIAWRVALWPSLLLLTASRRGAAPIWRWLVAPAGLVALLIGSAGIPALPLWISIAAGIRLAARLTPLLSLRTLRLIWSAIGVVLTIGWIWRAARAARAIRRLL